VTLAARAAAMPETTAEAEEADMASATRALLPVLLGARVGGGVPLLRPAAAAAVWDSLRAPVERAAAAKQGSAVTAVVLGILERCVYVGCASDDEDEVGAAVDHEAAETARAQCVAAVAALSWELSPREPSRDASDDESADEYEDDGGVPPPPPWPPTEAAVEDSAADDDDGAEAREVRGTPLRSSTRWATRGDLVHSRAVSCKATTHRERASVILSMLKIPVM